MRCGVVAGREQVLEDEDVTGGVVAHAAAAAVVWGLVPAAAAAALNHIGENNLRVGLASWTAIPAADVYGVGGK